MDPAETDSFSLVVVKVPVETAGDSEFIEENVDVRVVDAPELEVNVGDDDDCVE